MDYTELVKSLRICGEWGTEVRIPGEPSECDGCSYYNAENDDCKSWDEPWRKEHLLLDAADAIEELQKDLERSKEYEAFWEKGANEALQKFQVAIASKPRWIPVTERLPLCGDAVLCVGDNGISLADFVRGDKWCALPWFYVDGEQETGVTNWMPLPEPPKEETE